MSGKVIAMFALSKLFLTELRLLRPSPDEVGGWLLNVGVVLVTFS